MNNNPKVNAGYDSPMSVGMKKV